MTVSFTIGKFITTFECWGFSSVYVRVGSFERYWDRDELFSH